MSNADHIHGKCAVYPKLDDYWSLSRSENYPEMQLLTVGEGDQEASVFVSPEDARRIASTALRLSGCDLVGAARRVVDALTEVRVRATNEDPEDEAFLDACDERDDAIDALAAELVKLDEKEGA